MNKQRSSSSNKADLTALFRLSTTDIADRLNAMLDTERKPQYRCRDYLRHNTPHEPNCADECSTEASSYRHGSRSRSRSTSTRCKKTVTAASRNKIVQWLNDCVDYLDLPRECIAVAMSYVDRFMSSSGSSNSNKNKKLIAQARQDATIYQLIAISSLLLATKQVTDKLSLVEARTFAKVSHGSYTPQEILDMEVVILEALEWRLCGPSAQCVGHHVIALLAKICSARNRCRIASMVDFTRLQIELAVGDYSTSVLRLPSEVALGSVLNSMDLLDFSPKERCALDCALMDWTGLNVQCCGVEETREELHDVFDRQSSDVLSRATFSSQTTSAETGIESKNQKKKNKSFYSTRSPVCVTDEFDKPVNRRRRASRDDRKSVRPDVKRLGRHEHYEPRRIPLEP